MQGFQLHLTSCCVLLHCQGKLSQSIFKDLCYDSILDRNPSCLFRPEIGGSPLFFFESQSFSSALIFCGFPKRSASFVVCSLVDLRSIAFMQAPVGQEPSTLSVSLPEFIAALFIHRDASVDVLVDCTRSHFSLQAWIAGTSNYETAEPKLGVVHG